MQISVSVASSLTTTASLCKLYWLLVQILDTVFVRATKPTDFSVSDFALSVQISVPLVQSIWFFIKQNDIKSQKCPRLFVLQLICGVTDLPQIHSHKLTGQKQAEL
jgi:hypothetical protein